MAPAKPAADGAAEDDDAEGREHEDDDGERDKDGDAVHLPGRPVLSTSYITFIASMIERKAPRRPRGRARWR
jgi:hypothetical protein